MGIKKTKRRPTSMGRLVILGIGNPYRGDDGVGLVVARSLRERAPRDVVVLEQGGDPAALIEAWEGAGVVLLIDAVSSGAKPGELHVIDAGSTPLARDLFRHSTHSFGVAEAVELARTLGKLPPTLWIYGIEGKDFGTGSSLSTKVAEAVDRTVDTVLDKIRELGSSPQDE
jgi:hydrogenase maturation protease